MVEQVAAWSKAHLASTLGYITIANKHLEPLTCEY